MFLRGLYGPLLQGTGSGINRAISSQVINFLVNPAAIAGVIFRL